MKSVLQKRNINKLLSSLFVFSLISYLFFIFFVFHFHSHLVYLLLFFFRFLFTFNSDPEQLEVEPSPDESSVPSLPLANPEQEAAVLVHSDEEGEEV